MFMGDPPALAGAAGTLRSFSSLTPPQEGHAGFSPALRTNTSTLEPQSLQSYSNRGMSILS
jgi:hypothetical protein